MKKSFLTSMVTCILFFVSATSFAATYDATGLWNYSQSGLYNNCQEPNVPESGQTILIQNGDSATLLLEGRTLSGTVNGSIYTFTDYLYEDEGWTDLTITLTLSSNAVGGGPFAWTWSDGDLSCGGGGQLSVNKQSQAPAVYDANGNWNYSISGHYNYCNDPNEQDEEGTFTVTQTGNRVTAVDNHADSYTGWVNGSAYTFARSYPDDGGTTTDVYTITLTSQTSGAGPAVWYWNNVYEKCTGGFSISISKQQAASALSPAIPFLLFDVE